MLRSHLRIVLIFCVLVFVGNETRAQYGLRETLEAMDKNENGVIEPEEITPLARPYFEYLSRVGSWGGRLSVDRPNEISRIQEIARRFNSVKNGSSGRRDVEPEIEPTLKGFGIDSDQPLVPEFGLRENKFRYTQADLDFAYRTLSSHDENKDGYIDRDEASRHKWTHRNPFDDDLDGDDRLSRLELTQRYARRRMLERDKNELVRKAWRTGGEIKHGREEERREDQSQWWRRGGSDYWLTASLFGRFDRDKNGVLTDDEYDEIGIPVGRIDANRNGEVTRDELFGYIKKQQDEEGGSDTGPPGWFNDLDKDRDGQVSMIEFTDDWTDQKILRFEGFDLNDDGLLTPMEVVRSKSSLRRLFSNNSVTLLPPKKTVISEIEVQESVSIEDLDVQLSITHTHVTYLDAYIVGPDGQRVELFTAVGGQDDNFDMTIFDDEAEEQIIKGRPPFEGSFQTEAHIKKQPDLGHFKGQSTKGVWQLIVRGTRSNRFGLLHGWSLMVKPAE